MVAPPGTPPDVAQRLRQAMIEIKEQPDVQARMVDAGDQFNASPTEMADFLLQERQRWSDLIRSTGITAHKLFCILFFLQSSLLDGFAKLGVTPADQIGKIRSRSSARNRGPKSPVSARASGAVIAILNHAIS